MAAAREVRSARAVAMLKAFMFAWFFLLRTNELSRFLRLVLYWRRLLVLVECSNAGDSKRFI